MMKKFDGKVRKDAFSATNKAGFELWKITARAELLKLTGMSNMESCEPDCVLLSSDVTEDGVTRKKYILQTEPGIYLPFYILYPPKEKQIYAEQTGLPSCMLALAGHAGGGKESVAGRYNIPAIYDAVKKFNYDYGYALAREGYTVFCPDPRGFGEMREAARQSDLEEDYINGSCYQLAHMAEPLGQTVIGMFVWDLMRLIDYIETSGEFDMSELGCVGFSGGGMQTLWLCALDDRVKRMLISGYMYGYKDSLLVRNGNCNCNYVPHLWEHFDMGDILALAAPRPLLVQSCKEDHLNGSRGLINVREQLCIVKKAYDIFDAGDRLVHDIREGGHCFHQEALRIFTGIKLHNEQ